MAEEWMSRLQCRGSIARAAVVIAVLSSRPAEAQVGVDPGPPREHAGLLKTLANGAYFDKANLALAEHRLEHLQAKLRHHAEQGNTAAVGRDVCHIENTQYCMAIHEWLYLWNMRQYPGFYPVRTDAISLAAIAQSTHPVFVPFPSGPIPTSTSTAPSTSTSTAPSTPPAPSPPTPTPSPTSSAPTIAITIVNAEPAGGGVAFAIDGVPHQADDDSSQDLKVAPGATITYDAGGPLGERRYRLSPGVYEFRLNAEGWALYKLPGTP
jgi:hypothetical protein